MSFKLIFRIPTWPYFYRPVFKSVTLRERGIQILGPYQGKLVYDGISEVIVEESSFGVSGEYFLDLLKRKDQVFSKRLFNLGKDLTKLADKLQKIYYMDMKTGNITDIKKFYSKYLNIFSLAVGFGYSLDYAFDNYLKENKIQLTNIVPSGLSFMTREKIELKKIFEVKNLKERDKKLRDHWYRYAWLLNNYTGEHKISLNYFLERESEVKTFDVSEVKKIRGVPKDLDDWMSYLIFLRDERKRVNMLANGLLDRYLKKECKKRGIDYLDAVFCTVEEFESLKNTPAKIPRRRERILKFTDKGYEDISQDEWIRLTREEVSFAEELSGQVASPGFVKGKAKVIFSRKDFPKIEIGDVLVASMTRPEFAPILGKCSAIITVEGGITCHAAIVSRELKKPCIIGVKGATEIIKDGDLIQIDANKGIATILERAK